MYPYFYTYIDGSEGFILSDFKEGMDNNTQNEQSEQFISPFQQQLEQGYASGSIGSTPAQPNIDIASIKEDTDSTNYEDVQPTKTPSMDEQPTEEKPLGYKFLEQAQQREIKPVPIIEPPKMPVLETPVQPTVPPTGTPIVPPTVQPHVVSTPPIMETHPMQVGNTTPVDVNMVLEVPLEMKVFAGALSDKVEAKEMKNFLLRTFGRNNIFKNEYYILYSIIHDKPKVKISDKFIQLYLQTNRAHFSNTQQISLANYKIGGNDEYAEFMLSCINTWRECTQMDIEEEEYYTAVEMIKMEFSTEHAITALQDSVKILTEGMKYFGRDMKGYEDMKKYVNREFLKIDNVVNQTDRQGIVAFGDTTFGDEDDPLKLVTTFGIEGLDEAIHGLYEGDMCSFLAPPKGFKSRTVLHVAHNAAVNFKCNVAIWALENGKKVTESILRAKHFDWYYNRQETDITKQRILDSDMIRRNALDDELKSLEMVSKTDLYTNPDYGKLYFIDEDFDPDTFTDTLEKVVKEHGVKLIIIDYLQLVTGSEGKQKNQRVGEAYQKTLRFLKTNKVAGLMPGQVTQDTLDYIERKGVENLANLELRDIGAESAEVLRTPDINILNYGTMEDIRKGRLYMVGLPSRNFAPFLPIKVRVRAGVASFTSVPNDAW